MSAALEAAESPSQTPSQTDIRGDCIVLEVKSVLINAFTLFIGYENLSLVIRFDFNRIHLCTETSFS